MLRSTRRSWPRGRGLGLELAFFLAAAACFTLGGAPWTGRGGDEGYEPGPRAPGTLRVATWNVGGAASGGPRPLDDETLEHVASALNRLDPDLCFLQEVAGGAQLERLRRALGEGWGPPVRAAERGPVFLGRRGAYLPFPRAEESGGAVEVLFLPTGGPGIVAVGVHASAWSARERNLRIGAWAERALELRWSGRTDGAAPHAVVLAGDLNLDLDLDKRRDLFSDDAHLDVETYNWLAARLVDVARGRGTTAEPDRRLDYVLVSPERFEVRGAGPVKGLRRGAMDHDPVVADLVPRSSAEPRR